MTLQPLFPVTQQFQAKNGSNLVSGKIYIYYQGRTALATTYHDEAGTVVNANPVLLDNNGRATVFADTAYSYTIVVCDYYGKELFSQDITLHDVTESADEITLIGSDGSIHIDTSSSNGVKTFDMSANTDILATKKSVDDLSVRVKKNEDDIKVISGNVENIATEMSGKKDKQSELTFNGSATKTVKSITQNVNGELNVEFEDINLPQEVPNVEISSEDNSVKVTETTDTQTNTKKFDLSVDVDDKIPDPSTSNPLMNGTAAVGVSTKYAREDHVHPSDTSKEDIVNKTTVILGTSDIKYPTDKAVAEFVNSSVATNTANYISNNGEPFTSVEQLEAYSGTVTNNDYAFVTGTDSEGNTYYDRYKATVSGSTVTWALEYRLNNSSFTAAQWAAINSGVTSDKVNYWDGKQDALTFDGTYNGSNNKAATVSSITSRINDLDAAVTSTDGTNVQVKVTETDGKVTAVNITKDNTASKSDVNNKMDKQTAGNTSTPIYIDNGVAQEVTSIAAATAGTLTTPRKIDGVEFNGSSDIVHYGVCSTSQSVIDKVISCPGFVLTTGARITIKFTQNNNFREPTFNVNDTGAVPVRYFGSLLPAANFLRAGAVYQFVYDGASYCFVGNFDNNNFTYQSSLSTNAEYPMLCKNSANQTAENYFVHYASGITMNPSTNKITASGGFVGDVSGTASKAVSDNSGNVIDETYVKNTELDSRVPAPTSTTGTQVLKCINGVIQWVNE